MRRCRWGKNECVICQFDACVPYVIDREHEAGEEQPVRVAEQVPDRAMSAGSAATPPDPSGRLLLQYPVYGGILGGVSTSRLEVLPGRGPAGG